MSRQTATKGRNDKGKTTSAPTPAITHDIVPGKFTDQDWHLMLDHDDGDYFGTDIVEEICSSAMDIILQKYLDRQLTPYIVSQAKEAILQITEWQFLFKDEGESSIERDPAWAQDEEPVPWITDCWAQGSVPCRISTPVTSRPVTALERILEEPGTQELPEDVNKLSEQANKENVIEQESEQATEENTIEELNQGENKQKETVLSASSEEAPQTDKSQRKKKVKRYRGQLGSAHVSKMTDSLEQTEMEMLLAELSPLNAQSPDPDSLQMPNSCHSLLKLQAGRPPAQRDVAYDNTGSITMLRKINPTRLPSHRVKTGFQIMDPTKEVAKARLEAMRTGRHAKVPQPPQSQPTSSRSRPRPRGFASQNSSNEPAVIASNMFPQLLEIMELSPGVTLKEGERTKTGPKPYSRNAELKQEGANYSLRPVSMKMTGTRIEVQDLLDRQSPIIRPLVESPPIPPIQPHPPSQAVL